MYRGGRRGLLPSYNERVAYIYIYVGGTFLDKEELSLFVLRSGSASNYEGPFSLRAFSSSQPSWDGSGRANKAETPPLGPKDISLTHERVNVLVCCLDERGGFREERRIWKGAAERKDCLILPLHRGILACLSLVGSIQGMIASYSYGHRFYLFARDPGINRVFSGID